MKRSAWRQVGKRPRQRLDFWRLSADLAPVERRPLAGQVADQIRRKISSGELRSGQRIESSRKLALELRVSLPTVREALAALAYVGMIDIRHGVGVFVARRQPAARMLRVSHRRARRSELHALRQTIEAELAARAASRRRTPRQELDLQFMLEERHRAVLAGEPEAFTRSDLDLHRFVAGVAGSPLHAALGRMAGEAVRTEMAGRARRLALDERLDELHRGLVNAISESDADAAREAAMAIAVAEAAGPD